MAKKPAKQINSFSDLLPDDRNANKGSERGTGLIEKSLRTYGAGRSILVDRNGKIIAGNKTTEGCASAGMDRVRVVQTDGKELVVVQRTDLDLDTDKAARELAIADNRAGQVSLEWDAPVLEGLAEEFDIDLQDVGFAPGELERMAALPDPLGESPDIIESDIPSDAPKRCGKGDLWSLGDHWLLCGDCREKKDMARLMGKAKINVAVTSPPYASQRKYDETSGFKPIPPDEYVAWWEAVQANVKAYLAVDGSFFVNIKPHCDDGQRVLYVLDLVAAMARTWGWQYVDEFCWRNTRNGVPGKWPNRLKNAWEPVYHFDTGGCQLRHDAITHKSDSVFAYSPENAKATSGSGLLGAEKAGGYQEGDALPSNVIEIPAESGSGDHSAPYPVGLPAFFLKAFSDAGDIVFEPFCGSGTTLIAADQLGRRCYATEISPKYCDVILARWEKLTGKKAERVQAEA